MRNDLTPDQMPIKPRTSDETRRAQVAVCAYALRAGDAFDAATLAVVLFGELGLNGRPMRSAKHGKTKAPARVSANPPGRSPGGPKEGT